MIQLYDITKVYPGGIKALDNITISFNRGEFIFLVGPSGAGKSTLTKLIYREELPTSGQVVFNGRNVTRMRQREVPYLRRKIGMVFQDFRLLPQKTVFENVAFALEITGASSRKIAKAVPEALELVSLAQKAGAFPEHLSGGEQQRVSVARAIVNNPDMIIADEPTGNLDPETSRELMKLFLDINQQGATIIMVTHAWDIVDAMKKRVVELAGGRVVRDEEKGTYHP
ncbi:MAG: Cell division ATP-binding protein FtsE [Pelotomaculum sp. PtaB.Bin104]|nr:MAG: Cell division ATP-binding protein FtsE [Pelotomaculum sp. PtaB.Bin104]